MRTLGVLVICLALLPQVAAEAKQKRSLPVQAVAVEKVVKAGPETNGDAFLLELQLKNGQQAAYQLTPTDADKVSKGFRKPVKLQYSDVLSIQYDVDPQRQCVILIPQTEERILDGLCFPLTSSDQLIERLKMEFAQLRPELAEKRFSPVNGALAVEKVVKASQEAGGEAFRLELQLKNGRHVAHQFTPADADEVSKGLSNPLIKAVGKASYSLVFSLHTEVDLQHQRVILIPRTQGGTSEPLGLSLKDKDGLIASLQEKFAQLKAGAAKQGSRPDQTSQQRPADKQPAKQK